MFISSAPNKGLHNEDIQCWTNVSTGQVKKKFDIDGKDYPRNQHASQFEADHPLRWSYQFLNWELYEPDVFAVAMVWLRPFQYE